MKPKIEDPLVILSKKHWFWSTLFGKLTFKNVVCFWFRFMLYHLDTFPRKQCLVNAMCSSQNIVGRNEGSTTVSIFCFVKIKIYFNCELIVDWIFRNNKSSDDSSRWPLQGTYKITKKKKIEIITKYSGSPYMWSVWASTKLLTLTKW